MPKKILTAILTLVLLQNVSHAAPRSDVEDILETTQESDGNTKKVDLDEENISLSVPKPPKTKKRRAVYYPFTQSISPRLGSLVKLDEFKQKPTGAFEYLIGFNYLLYSIRSPHYEIGADLVSNAEGHLNIAKRWIIAERSGFRPFYKAGVLLRMVGNEGFATFANIKNYMACGSVGIEDYFKAPLSLRLELELAVGTERNYLLLVFGYSWAW